MKVLCTKKLTVSQQEILTDFEVLEVPMITISFTKSFKVDDKVEHAIFTSANSVTSVFKVHQNKVENFKSVYCVGNKTKYLLEKHGLKVGKKGKNALELGDLLIKEFEHHQESVKNIHWFCGNLKNVDFPRMMTEKGVLVTEHQVYQTTLTPKKVIDDFDVVLFFSPSGIKSFLKMNKSTTKPIVCIGSTTANEAVKHFENVYMAEQQTVESVLLKAKEIIEA